MADLGAQIQELVRTTRDHYRQHARTYLPWRKTRDPYRILVSELMLQQTQAQRVVQFYTKFLRAFPTVRALAAAPLSEVLRSWQGLGYNRRAKFLHEAAKEIVMRHGGRMPQTAQELETLPGIGPYTARAVAAFAYNAPEVLIETNIRTVFVHHCFAGSKALVVDREVLPLIEKALHMSRMPPHDFYAALMDYGAHLKRSGVRLNTRSKHYTKQSKFEGSARQVRGAVVRLLLERPATVASLAKTLARDIAVIQAILARLHSEGLIDKKGRSYYIRVC